MQRANHHNSSIKHLTELTVTFNKSQDELLRIRQEKELESRQLEKVEKENEDKIEEYNRLQ